jgi:hypothetical protein
MAGIYLKTMEQIVRLAKRVIMNDREAGEALIAVIGKHYEY